MRLLIIIPAYNEEQTIGEVIDSLPKSFVGIRLIKVVTIDDGSVDKTSQVAKAHGAIVLNHICNRGLGAALGTGFSYAVMNKYDLVVTADADGQHAGRDVNKIIETLLKVKADVVVGSRLLKTNSMPLVRKIINWLSNITTWFLFGIWTTDSQSGLRGFTKKALSKMNIRSERMEVSSEIFKEISRLGLRLVEVPITTIYTHYSLKKGQSITNAPNVLLKLLQHRFS